MTAYVISVASEVTQLKIIKRLNKHILIFLFSSEELLFGKQTGIKRFMRREVQSDWSRVSGSREHSL